MQINVTAFVNQLGYGVAGLNIVKAMGRLGHEPSLWINGPGQIPNEDAVVIDKAIQRGCNFNPSAPSFRIAHQWDMAQSVGRGVRSGLTFFELDRLKEHEVHSLNSLDVVFVPSYWAMKVCIDSGVKSSKVALAPLGVDNNLFDSSAKPVLPKWMELESKIRKNNTTVFLACGKWEYRKGHDAILRAFCKAFSTNDNVLLVTNCFNPFLSQSDNLAWENWFTQSSMGANIICLKERQQTQREVVALMSLADCGVFPARAEGWNLELLEMMSMGKAVIATNYSAHQQFCTKLNSLLVEIDDMESAYDGTPFFDGFGQWAKIGDAQLDQIVTHMREVHKHKQNGLLYPNAAVMETAKAFSWENTVTHIMEKLS